MKMTMVCRLLWCRFEALKIIKRCLELRSVTSEKSSATIPWTMVMLASTTWEFHAKTCCLVLSTWTKRDALLLKEIPEWFTKSWFKRVSWLFLEPNTCYLALQEWPLDMLFAEGNSKPSMEWLINENCWTIRLTWQSLGHIWHQPLWLGFQVI